MADRIDQIDAYLDGLLDPAGAEELRDWINADQAHARRFAERAILQSEIRSILKRRQIQSLQSPGGVLNELLEMEAHSDTGPVDITKLAGATTPDRGRGEHEPFTKHDAGVLAGYVFKEAIRSRLVWAGAAAAAVLITATLLIVFSGPAEEPDGAPAGGIAVDPPGGVGVAAVLAQTIDVDQPRWDRAHRPGGDGFVAGRYRLSEGAVRLRLADGTRVKLTAPVDFELSGRNEIALSRGQLVADVPPQALGFRVHTPAGDVVDLGTTFGVEVLDDRTTEVTVIDGLVRVAAKDGAGTLGEFVEVTASRAARLNGPGRRVIPIPAESGRFTMDYVRGLDLVDVVAGGDGKGAARMRAINPLTGQPTSKPLTSSEALHLEGDGVYRAVVANPFIDGVFIPVKDGPSQIDSSGRTIAGLRLGHTHSYGLVWAGGLMPSVSTNDALLSAIRTRYPDSPLQAPVLYMPPNKGITLDLDAIRGAHGHDGPMRVVASAELVRSPIEDMAVSDIHCLVDGEAEAEVIGISHADGRVSIDFAVPADARFLTLIVVDSGDGTASDWVVFHEPRLEWRDPGND